MNDRSKSRAQAIRSKDEKGVIQSKLTLTFKMILSKPFLTAE